MMLKLKPDFLKFFFRESDFCRPISLIFTLLKWSIIWAESFLIDRKPFSNRDLIPGWCSKSGNSHGQSALSPLQDLHNWPHTGDVLKESPWCLQNTPVSWLHQPGSAKKTTTEKPVLAGPWQGPVIQQTISNHLSHPLTCAS